MWVLYKMAKKSIFDNLKSTAGHIDKSLHKAQRAKRQSMRLKRQVAAGKVAKAEKTAAKVYRSSKQAVKQAGKARHHGGRVARKAQRGIAAVRKFVE